MDYLTFLPRALVSLLYCLWGGVGEWTHVLRAQWAYLSLKHGRGSTVTMEQWLWELDQEAEMPEVWDTVSFWHELWGVVEGREVWEDNTLRFDVRVTVSPSQRYLRSHEIDKIRRHKGKEREGESE